MNTSSTCLFDIFFFLHMLFCFFFLHMLYCVIKWQCIRITYFLVNNIYQFVLVLKFSFFLSFNYLINLSLKRIYFEVNNKLRSVKCNETIGSDIIFKWILDRINWTFISIKNPSKNCVYYYVIFQSLENTFKIMLKISKYVVHRRLQSYASSLGQTPDVRPTLQQKQVIRSQNLRILFKDVKI